MEIEWDPNKAKSNVAKHGIYFSDVEAAFYDPFAIVISDDHAEGEERFILLGADATGKIVTAAYTHRGDVARLISARPATKRERKCYEKGIRF